MLWYQTMSLLHLVTRLLGSLLHNTTGTYSGLELSLMNCTIMDTSVIPSLLSDLFSPTTLSNAVLFMCCNIILLHISSVRMTFRGLWAFGLDETLIGKINYTQSENFEAHIRMDWFVDGSWSYLINVFTFLSGGKQPLDGNPLTPLDGDPPRRNMGPDRTVTSYTPRRPLQQSVCFLLECILVGSNLERPDAKDNLKWCEIINTK